MAIKTLEQEIAELRQKEMQLKNRILNKENQLKTQQRKDDTRKKILIGSYVIDTLERKGSVPPLTSDTINEYLGKFLTRKFDRKLFNLSEIEEVEVEHV